ncbi:MAG: glycerol-3-phosphate 1-O-acyltransferase PlsY [Gammaproteobacteria bacterium]|nr:acyl-phosphate glycerol 3-phosphate acyltransferase [Gammaproteobacteria bacterium]
MLELGLKFTIAYLLGSVLGSLVVGYLKGGVDIRRLGSGNPGSTNAFRTQGKWFALWVIVIDVAKGIVAAAWLPGWSIPGVGFDPAVSRDLVLYAVAFGAILGHVFPVWFDFRGGKGAATAAGLLIFLDPVLGAVVLAAWIGVVALTGYVGLATMTAAVLGAAAAGVLRWPEEQGFVLFAACVAALIIFTHRSNIRRMLNRTEPRFGRAAGGK